MGKWYSVDSETDLLLELVALAILLYFSTFDSHFNQHTIVLENLRPYSSHRYFVKLS